MLGLRHCSANLFCLLIMFTDDYGSFREIVLFHVNSLVSGCLLISTKIFPFLSTAGVFICAVP